MVMLLSLVMLMSHSFENCMPRSHHTLAESLSLSVHMCFGGLLADHRFRTWQMQYVATAKVIPATAPPANILPGLLDSTNQSLQSAIAQAFITVSVGNSLLPFERRLLAEPAKLEQPVRAPVTREAMFAAIEAARQAAAAQHQAASAGSGAGARHDGQPD